MKKLRIGILGATGMVGQRFITLLSKHPWFEVVVVAASHASRGKKYFDAVDDRWKMDQRIPENVSDLIVKAVEEDMEEITNKVDFVFSALDIDKEIIKRIENRYAGSGIPVVSNNSAHRWTEDVPMVIPEVNSHHIRLIDIQRKNHGWKKGFIAVKPNCSIQSYVAVLTALRKFNPLKISIVSLQAISGAGKTFESWPQMVDNVIPFIRNEEEKSEREPMKIWGEIENEKLKLADKPQISATCIRVPVSDGHMVNCTVLFEKQPEREEILEAVKNYDNPLSGLGLPSAPKQFIRYFEEDDRPQTKSERDFEKGMGITMGRLREDKLFHWKFIALSHNTIRGAAGGAILLAELLMSKGYLV